MPAWPIASLQFLQEEFVQRNAGFTWIAITGEKLEDQACFEIITVSMRKKPIDEDIFYCFQLGLADNAVEFNPALGVIMDGTEKFPDIR